MKQINKLIIRARKAAQGGEYCCAVGIVDYDPDTRQYAATAKPLDGVKGSNMDAFTGWEIRHYDTQEKAANALCELFSGLGIPEENFVIFTMDYGLED